MLMPALKQTQSPLLSLPAEIRLKIWQATLAGWHILLDAWCNSLEDTLTLDRRLFGPDALVTFHVCRQMRHESIPLIGRSATMCFFRGPLEKPAGRPLPALLRENIQHVLVSPGDISSDYELPFVSLPALQNITFGCGHGFIDGWPADWSRNWANYRTLDKEHERKLVDEARETCLGVQWVEDMHENGSLPWHITYEDGIVFPNIKGQELRTAWFKYTCDFRRNIILTKSFTESEELWPGDNGDGESNWVLPVKDLWTLGDNAKLDKVVIHKSGRSSR